MSAVQPQTAAMFDLGTIRVPGNASYLPAELRHQPAPIFIEFTPTKAERKVYRKRKQIKVSEWAERHRIMSRKASSRPGSWKNTETPYLTDIMDAAFFPSVRTIILCKAPQFGGSEAINNCIGYSIDRAPGPVLYIYPNEKDARKNIKRRVLDMIQSSPRLRGFLTGMKDDESSLLINLQHISIRAAWARSAQSLASTHERYVVFDETDQYEGTAKDADPISLGEKRARTYRGREKIFKISSPTIESGYIWQALIGEAQVVFKCWVRCPDCNNLQLMNFDRIKWPRDEKDPEKIENDLLAWYECEKCASQWDDYKRNLALKSGVWRDDKSGLSVTTYLERYRPKKIGFHGPSWLSPFVSLSEVAADFLRGQPGAGVNWKEKLRDFMNGHKAEPWLEYHKPRKFDVLLKLRDGRPEGAVPGNNQVACLVAGVDTQDDSFYYKIVALGYGLNQEAWLVRYGKVLTFEALEEILWQHEYKDAAGLVYPVQFTVQDAMGHRTADVYDFCLSHPGLILPSQGHQTKAQPFTFGNQEYYPGTTKKKIEGGLTLVHVNTTYYKNRLANKLEVKASDPGAFHMHADTDEDFARQIMTSEYRDDKGIWVQRGNQANHYLDCGVQCFVAADVLGVKHWPQPDEQPQATEDDYETARPGNL